MRVKPQSAQWKEEALTTWRASLATRGVVARNRDCGRREGREACVTHLESRDKTLEAMLSVPNIRTGCLREELSILSKSQYYSVRTYTSNPDGPNLYLVSVT